MSIVRLVVFVSDEVMEENRSRVNDIPVGFGCLLLE